VKNDTTAGAFGVVEPSGAFNNSDGVLGAVGVLIPAAVGVLNAVGVFGVI
jgi:hypothetical protein